MARVTYKPEWQRALIALSAVVVAVTIVGAIYWARAVLIPVALAVFLTFVLAPLVRFLEKRGLGRSPAVILVVGATGLVFVGTVFVIGQQLASLTTTLPDYAENIKGKVGTIRGWLGAGEQSRMERFFEEVQEAVSPAPRPVESWTTQKVVVEAQDAGWQAQLQEVLGSAAEGLGQAAFAFILVVFMLIKKEDLRNRMLRLAAAGKVTTATKAMDDASRRISRYLLAQLLLNTAFGLVVTVGLAAIGVPYAILWGFIGTVMRYVPYIGTWFGLVPPALFSLAVSDGLWQPAAVVALFLGLEALCNNIFEPWLYGTSLGMSEVAQLIAAAFWAFLWGPVGLILSGPLTTCLLVAGKYVPQLRFFEVLLGDDPPLPAGVAFFQRLTARDQDEASKIARAAVAASAAPEDPARVFDEVLVPALRLAKSSAEAGELSDEDERFILTATREIAEEIADAVPHAETPYGPRVRVLACPARGDADRAALDVFAGLLPPDKWEVEVTADETLTSELLELVGRFDPGVVLIGAMPPGGVAHTRYLCKRLRSRFPGLKLVVGRFGGLEDDDDPKDAKELGADVVVSTLAEARDEFAEFFPVLRSAAEASGAVPGGRANKAAAEPVGTGSA